MLGGRFWGTVLVCVAAISRGASADDWPRFRGPNGSGVSSEAAALPARWSPEENLLWKAPLPGPGSSSPIVIGDDVYVTCWSGYALDRRADPGNLRDLKLHLVCVDLRSGKMRWTADVEPHQPEEPYRGMFAEHGYASHTPTSDGERVYAYFGKTGALAFDRKGNQLWQTKLGEESDPTGWGTASSPILYKNLLIVTASAESEALVALDKATGNEVWRQEARGFSGTWGTPILVDVDGERTDLVIAVPNEIWGFDPETGKLRWYCDGISDRSFCSSVVSEAGIVYAVEGMGGGSIAVRAGGSGDVTKSHVLWRERDNNRISTPLLYEGRLFTFSRGIAQGLQAERHERLFQARLTSGSGAAAAEDRPAEPRRSADRSRGESGRGGFGGGFGGRGGGQDYASPVLGDGKIYFQARSGDVFVLKYSDHFEQLSVNRVTEEEEDFSGTPAISRGRLVLRSSRGLYCVGE